MSESVEDIALEILDDVVAPTLIAVICAGLWAGITFVFVYHYYKSFPRDSVGIKSTVVFSVTLQVLNIIIMTKMLYFYLVVSFGIAVNATIPRWELVASFVLLAIIDFIVQSFYAHRLCLLIGKIYILRAVVVCLPIPGLVFGLMTARFLWIAGSFLEFYRYSWMVVAWFAALAGCDIILTASQVFYLHSHRTGLAKSNRLLNVIILYITSSAIVASVLILIQLATFTVMGWNFTQSFLTFQTSGIRVLFLLANLNSRQVLLGVEGNTDYELPAIEKSFKSSVPSRFDSNNSSFGKPHNTITDSLATRTTVILSDNGSIVDINSGVGSGTKKGHL